MRIRKWSWIRASEFTDPDPYPGGQLITDPSDPDPQHCNGVTVKMELVSFVCSPEGLPKASQPLEQEVQRHHYVLYPTWILFESHSSTKLSHSKMQT
jgi:hypothetical protein